MTWPPRDDPFEKAMKVLLAKREARRRQLEEVAETVAEEVESLRRLSHGERTG